MSRFLHREIMMNAIWVLSLCQKKIDEDYIFHFKGVWLGNKISMLKVKTFEDLEIDEVYLFKMNVKSISGEILSGEMVKMKKLTEIRFSF